MWADDDDYGKSGGGFDVSGYDGPSAPSSDAKTSKKPSSLFRVAIKQIIESNEETMQIGGHPVSMMTIVGIVKSVEVTSTKVVFIVQDWSGIITGMLWLEGDSGDDQNPNVIENTYCRMTGTKRIHEGKACLFVYNVVPVGNLMELTYHYLQVIQVPLKAEELKSFNQERMNNPFDNNQTSTNTSNFASSDGLSLPPHQMKVYRILQSCQSDIGLNKNNIFDALQKQMPLIEIEKVLDFLVTEGHAYTTVDDDHFRTTDS